VHSTSGVIGPAYPRCARATTLREACVGLVEDLHERWALPSVYLLVDGRLRCQAARGYFQVVDGFTPETGVIGRVVTTGQPVVIHDVAEAPDFIAAIPGLLAEACVPVRVHGEVVGAVNVESATTLPVGIERELTVAAGQLGAMIEATGGIPPVPLAQHLARIAVEITALTNSAQIIERAVAGAIEMSGMTSGALSRLGPDGRWRVEYSLGPLAEPLRSWTDADHRVMAAWGAPGTSSHFPGGEVVPPEYDFLLRAGVHAIAVQPLYVSGERMGLLATADTAPVAHNPNIGAAVELLAAQTAASLGVASAIEELSRRAVQDPLTRLRNAGAFAEDLHRADRLERRSACLLIDVDHFKAVNDTYGHPAGDRLLCELAEQLSANLRDEDVLYRIGGDEFAAILVHTSPAEAAGVAQRLVDAARRVRTTVSIGVAMLEEGPISARQDADRALYDAKAAGRDRFVAAGF